MKLVALGCMLLNRVTLSAGGRVAPYPRLLAMQELGQHLAVMRIGCRGRDRMDQLCLAIHPNMRLRPEVPLVALLSLMHLVIPLLGPVRRRTGCTDDGGIHNGPSAHLQPLLRQIFPDPGKVLLAQLVGFQEMPELADRRLLGHGQ